MSVFAAGAVYFVPPDARPSAYHDDRRHVLMRRLDSDQEPGSIITASYASTSSRPRTLGASCHDIDGAHPQNKGCGFDRYTYVYPGIVASVDQADLTDCAGAVGPAHWSRIRDKFRKGLGIGTGIRGDPGVHGDSWRGVVVRVAEDFENDSGFRYGVIVTEHAFSAKQEWQTLVPVLDAATTDAIPPEFVEDVSRLLVREKGAFKHGLFAAELMSSVFHRADIAAVITMVEPSTMRRIDEMLVQYFALS